jgi:hypothetical protein
MSSAKDAKKLLYEKYIDFEYKTGGDMLLSKTLFVMLISLICVICSVTKSEASSDMECEQPLTIALQSQDLCFNSWDVMSIYSLNPYNDTRVNFALLLEDADVAEFIVKNNSYYDKTYEIPFYLGELTYQNALQAISQKENEKILSDRFEQEMVALRLNASDIQNALERLKGYNGGRCVSDNPETVLNFFRAIKDNLNAPSSDKNMPGLVVKDFVSSINNKSDISVSDKNVLANERLRMAGNCGGSDFIFSQLSVVSEEAKDFGAYLRGAAEFYMGQFKAAENSFNDLLSSSVPWVKETATYMLARVYLNQSQEKAEDKYGFFDKTLIDKVKLKQAETQFKTYLHHYPSGQYAASAGGLFRRIHWLSGDTGALAKEFSAQIARFQQNKPDLYALMMFCNEIDYLQWSNNDAYADEPILFAVAFLKNLRFLDDSKYKPIPIVESKKSIFTQAGFDTLYDFIILANQYYVEDNPPGVIQATNNRKVTDNPSNVEFSILTLRGLAFEKLQQWKDAESVWLNLSKHVKRNGQRAQLQLALLLNYERSGRLAEVFSPNSQFNNPKLHRILIKHAASDKLLKSILQQETVSAEDKGTALKTLLYKLLVRSNYDELSRIMDKYSIEEFQDVDGLYNFKWKGQSDPQYVCSSLIETVHSLSENPKLPSSLNCLGEFFRLFEAEIDPGYKPLKHHLGGTSDGFPEKTYSRLDYYLSVINNPASKGDAEAYALHRAIYCFATSGINHCGSQEIPQEQRRAWFQRLKLVYKNTSWAKQQKYYW